MRLRVGETSIAIGILMKRRNLDRDKAFGMLRAYARSQPRRLHDVAAEIVDAVEALNKVARSQPSNVPALTRGRSA